MRKDDRLETGGGGAKGKRILLVEDDPGSQELLQALLSKEFDLTTCASVEESLSKLVLGGYHLIITDIKLPGMTGFEILARMRKTGSLERCPVVFCSSHFDPGTKQKALDMGAAGFIPKPYQSDAVLAMVRSLLG